MRLSSMAVLVTDEVLTRISQATMGWGSLAVTGLDADELLCIVGAGEGDGPSYSISRETLRGHKLAVADAHPGTGTWYIAPAELHALHAWALRLRVALPVEALTSVIPQWRSLGPKANVFVLTKAVESVHRWAAWTVNGQEVVPHALTPLLHDTADPTTELAEQWPLQHLKASSITVVGVGSIGSAAAHALAMAGVGHLTLVDDDRLMWHNLVRHQGHRGDLGRYKVDAAAEGLQHRWPGTSVVPLRGNVIHDADQMRPLFAASDLILCAADGVTPRRVVSHLARRASKPAVLACVMMDGAVGEVLRLRPWPGSGCLLCQRADLIDRGLLDPEPALDQPYGTGARHRPMTAIGHDLLLVATLAAKVAVATILEAAGTYDQVVRGEHAVIGLRPDPNTLDVGAPFNVTSAQVAWSGSSPSRPDCPTCGHSK